MPLKKTASLKMNTTARRLRANARAKALKVFSPSQIKDKHVHHKNGDNTDNRPSNLALITPGSHGKKHGRGHGKLGTGRINNGS